MYVLQSQAAFKQLSFFFMLFMIRVFWCYVKHITCWCHFGFKIGHKLMNKECQCETEVRVSFDVAMCWILYRFCTVYINYGAQMAAVLDFWRVDCLFGGNIGVLKSVKFEVRRRQMPCLVFFKYQLSKGTILQVSQRLLTLFYQYKLTFLKMIDCIHLWKIWLLCWAHRNLKQHQPHGHRRRQQ